MYKIKFIEKQTKIDPALSKLFNIVVNYNQLNSPDKVGYCTSIYNDYFKENPDGSFDDAVNYYYQQVTALGKGLGMLVINTQMDKTFSFSMKLLNELEVLFMDDSKKYIEIKNYLDNLGYNLIPREDQYKSMLYKTLSIFQANTINSTDILNNIKKWYESILRFDKILLKEQAKKYLFDLLTINSMTGILIQNDILRFMASKYPNEVYATNNLFEKLDIDGFINGKRASIKSVNYRNSAYKKVARNDIEDLIGGPIIYYKIVNDTYKIDNINEVLEFYDVYGTNDEILKEIEQVKNRLIKIEA